MLTVIGELSGGTTMPSSCIPRSAIDATLGDVLPLEKVLILEIE